MKFLFAFLLIGVYAHPENVPANVQRTKQCPSGSELVGKQCVATEITTPSLVCPIGTSLLNGECASYAPASRLCPDGFHLSANDECTTTEIVPASLSCDSGELTSGNSCRVVKEIPSVCPPDSTTRPDGSCVTFTPLQKLCPTGYHLQGKECVRKILDPAQPICASGFFINEAGVCERPVPVPSYCPSGFINANSLCVKEIPKVPSPCPEDFLPTTSNQCSRIIETPPRQSCSEGFELLPNGGLCQKEVPVPSTCPTGSYRDSSRNQCLKRVQKQPKCDDDDADYVDGRCIKNSYFVPELHCADGLTLYQGKCKKVTTQDPISRCSTGYLKDGLCVSHSITSSIVSCPSGFSISKDQKCVRQISYDCSETTVTTECDMPEFVSALNNNHLLRRLNYKEKLVPVKSIVSKETVQKSAGSKEPKCTSVSRLIPKTCSRDEEKPIEIICADGSVPSGDSCSLINTSEPTKTCVVGQLDRATGKCTTLQIASATPTCRLGNLQPDGNCLVIEPKTVSYVCPDNASSNGSDCVVSIPEIYHPDQIISVTSIEVCDSGVQKGSICVEEEEKPRSEECPANAIVQNYTCYLYADLISSPPQYETQQPKYICPEGSLTEGTTCSREDSVSSEYICITGVEEERKCVHYVSPIAQPAKITHSAPTPLCSEGFKLEGNKCVAVVKQPAQLKCPNGHFRYQSGSEECAKPHSQVPVCPSGSQLQGKDCIRKIYSSPTVTEIKICTKGEPGC